MRIVKRIPAVVDVMMRTELTSQWFFVVAAIDPHRLEAHPTGALNAEMSKPADALNGNPFLDA
jgi:hypothetical protein